MFTIAALKYVCNYLISLNIYFTKVAADDALQNISKEKAFYACFSH
jgi:hypothetical protein